MEYPNRELAEELFEEYSEALGGEFRADEVDNAIEVLDSRYGLENLDMEDIQLERYDQDALEIELEGQEESPIYASPRHCVTHGNLTTKGDEELPPEGPALDNDGEVQGFGLR